MIKINGYEWTEHWARIPDTETGRTNGRTHGVAVLKSGNIVVFHQANPALLEFTPDGKLVRSWGDRFGGAHGLTLVHEEGQDRLWLTDQKSCEVVKMSLPGNTLMQLVRPDHPVYQQGGKYSPTWVAVNEERHGGNGDIWVADGYGSSLVHRYTKRGDYAGTISGAEGEAGPFRCPHGIFFDPRKQKPELYVADRGNQRIQVYDAEAHFKRVLGVGWLDSPDMFVALGNTLYVPELRRGLTLLDAQDKFITCVGDNLGVAQKPGWPQLPAAEIVPGKFNSPHAVAVAPDGTCYIVEWIVGGRITRLVPSAS